MLQVLIPLQVLLLGAPATELDLTTRGVNVIISKLEPATKFNFATGGVNVIHIPSMGSANQIHTSGEFHQYFPFLGHVAHVLCFYTCLLQVVSILKGSNMCCVYTTNIHNGILFTSTSTLPEVVRLMSMVSRRIRRHFPKTLAPTYLNNINVTSDTF